MWICVCVQIYVYQYKINNGVPTFSDMVLLFLHYMFIIHIHMKAISHKKINYKIIFKSIILYLSYAYLYPPLATFSVALLLDSYHHVSDLTMITCMHSWLLPSSRS